MRICTCEDSKKFLVVWSKQDILLSHKHYGPIMQEINGRGLSSVIRMRHKWGFCSELAQTACPTVGKKPKEADQKKA